MVPGATDGFVEDRSGNVTVLTGPAGATDVMALGLNNVNQVVGSFVDSAGNTDGFVYDTKAQTYTTIVDPNSNGMTTVNGINDLGQLVGFYLDHAGNTDGMLANPSSPNSNAVMSLQDFLPGLLGPSGTTTGPGYIPDQVKGVGLTQPSATAALSFFHSISS